MKKLLILIVCFSIHSAAFSQTIRDLDEVYPFDGDFAAIKKGNQWAFIDKEGKQTIDFRSDLVLIDKLNSSNQLISYPVFNDSRCLIRKLTKDYYRYGFINEKGEEIIKPQFLNATNFSNGFAIVVVQTKDSTGYNKVLKLPIMSNYMEEYVIDTSGELVKYLYNPRNYIPSIHKNNVPTIESKFIAPRMVAVKMKNGKWDIHVF